MGSTRAAPGAVTAPASIGWWSDAVVYQVYVRSFADGNGDGIGDIAGLCSRLDHLARLGVDAIWVNPWYRSPLRDGGYDVADYRRINEHFGTTADAEDFIAAAAEVGIRVLVDLVPNHTSSEHAWFVEALGAPPGSPARARYHFLDGRGSGGELPPNDWRSVFGGSAWTQVADGQWYLHLFDETQPDVNWMHPDVADEFESVMRFWLDRGAAGFRIDVAHALTKAPGYPDAGLAVNDGRAGPEQSPYFDRDDLHPIVRRWRRVLDEYDDRMMVAEAWVAAERRPLYLRPGEYHQAFDFDLLSAPWDAEAFVSIIEQSLATAAAVGSNATWVLSNHDVVRHGTRYGLPAGVDASAWLLDGPHHVLDVERGERRARAAAMLTMALPGSVYIYQGDELGLPEAWELPAEVLQDPMWQDSGRTVKGRDGCRVPIPWEPTGPSLGFGIGPPWLPQPDTFAALAVSVQEADPTSTLHLYREALAIRRRRFRPGAHLRRLAVDTGGIDTGDIDTDTGTDAAGSVGVVAFERSDGVRCVVNMGERPVRRPAGQVLLASSPLVGDELAPDTAVWLDERTDEGTDGGPAIA